VGRGDSTVRVSVEDSGAGVPEHLRDQLFDRFTRADKGGGSGLGLAIARAYAHALGGELLYRSDSPGARFELILPRL
jgi:signal transduction histidine kinase